MTARSQGCTLALLAAGACTTQVGGGPIAEEANPGDEQADFQGPDAGTRPEPDAQPAFSAPCGEGDTSIEIDGVCFEYFFEATSWSSARANCQAIAGDLAHIEDDATNGVIASLVSSASPEAWLRGTDAQAEGQWTWAGEPMSFTRWRAGEPNNGNGNENCMLIESNRGGSWDDRNCLDQKSYVCERIAAGN